MRKWLVQAALLTLLVAVPQARAQEGAALAREALRSSPELASIEAQIRALSQQVRRAGAWPDPLAAVEYSNIPIDEGVLGEHPMSGLQLKLQQTFLFPGKLSLRQQVARGEVRQEQLVLAEKKLQLQALVQRAYVQLALVRQLRQVSKEHITQVSQLFDVARVKYEVGKVGQQDLLRLRVLRSRLRDDLGDYDEQEAALLGRINGALSRSITQAIPTPGSLAAPQPPASVSRLLALARDKRPLLALYRQQAETQQDAAKQAAREGYPDLTAWLGYRLRLAAGADQGTDFLTAGISLPLPLFYGGRWGSTRQASLERARAAQAAGRAALDALAAELAATLASWRRSYRKAHAYREQLVPEARQTLDATFAAYQVDRAQFADLYQAEVQLLDFERSIYQAQAGAAISQVAASALVGVQVQAARQGGPR